MRCAIFTRVSTEEQATEGYSISLKRKDSLFCERPRLGDYRLLYRRGFIRKNTKRPELQRMIEHIEKTIDCVLVYKLDRLTRSVLDLYKPAGDFRKHNCKFRVLLKFYDTTSAIGRLFTMSALPMGTRKYRGTYSSRPTREKSDKKICFC